MTVSTLEENLKVTNELYANEGFKEEGKTFEKVELDDSYELFDEEYEKYAVTKALLPLFKKFYLQDIKESIKVSIDCGEDDLIIENYISEYGKFMSLNEYQQLAFLQKAIGIVQNKHFGGYFNELFEATLELGTGKK